MEKSKYDIFISYSRIDKERVEPVVNFLTDKGYKCWMDLDGIESGDAFKTKIVSAIEDSKIFLFFSSQASNKSKFTVKEVNTAIHLNRLIIPVKLDHTDYSKSILFDLAGIDFVDLSDSKHEKAMMKRMLRSIGKEISKMTSEEEIPSEIKFIDSLNSSENGNKLDDFHSLQGKSGNRTLLRLQFLLMVLAGAFCACSYFCKRVEFLITNVKPMFGVSASYAHSVWLAFRALTVFVAVVLLTWVFVKNSRKPYLKYLYVTTMFVTIAVSIFLPSTRFMCYLTIFLGLVSWAYVSEDFYYSITSCKYKLSHKGWRIICMTTMALYFIGFIFIRFMDRLL